jgi:hypothetical protein
MERRSFLNFALFAPAAVSDAAELLNVIPVDDQPAINAAKQAVLSDPLVRMQHNYVDIRDHALYDVLRVPKGEAVPEYFPFFSSPIGYNTPGTWRFKSYADTNSQRANSLPPPSRMIVERIVFLFSPVMAESDRQKLTSDFYWEFKLFDRVVARAPLAACPLIGEVAELFLPAPAIARTSPRRAAVQLPAPYSIHLRKPVVLESLQHFSFDLYGQAFTSAGDINLFVLLDGVCAFGIS